VCGDFAGMQICNFGSRSAILWRNSGKYSIFVGFITLYIKIFCKIDKIKNDGSA
jgi:hypothetical protein